MRRAPRLSFLPLLTAALAAALLALAPAAGAESPLDEYQRTGTINPCNPGVQGGGAAPNDVQQYAPDYLAALNEARRKGCDRGGSGGGNGNGSTAVAPGGGGGGTSSGPSGVPAGTPYVPKPPAPPKVVPTHMSPVHGSATGHLPLAARSDGGTPAPVIALAILFLLALLGAALAALGRWFGWRLGLMDPMRHAGGEAALRMGGAAGSLADWAREAFRRRP